MRAGMHPDYVFDFPTPHADVADTQTAKLGIDVPGLWERGAGPKIAARP
jgi:hypothetical protein